MRLTSAQCLRLEHCRNAPPPKAKGGPEPGCADSTFGGVRLEHFLALLWCSGRKLQHYGKLLIFLANCP